MTMPTPWAEALQKLIHGLLKGIVKTGGVTPKTLEPVSHHLALQVLDYLLKHAPAEQNLGDYGSAVVQKQLRDKNKQITSLTSSNRYFRGLLDTHGIHYANNTKDTP